VNRLIDENHPIVVYFPHYYYLIGTEMSLVKGQEKVREKVDEKILNESNNKVKFDQYRKR